MASPNKMIGVLITVMFFVAIIPTIALEVAGGGNLTGGSLVLFGLTTLVIVAGFVMYLWKHMQGGR